MSTVLGFALLLLFVWLLSRGIRDARGNSWAGPQTPSMRSRAASPRARSSGRRSAVLRSAGTAARSAGAAVANPGSGQIRAQAKADAHRIWQQAFATDHLEQRRHERELAAAAGVVAAADVVDRPRRSVLHPFKPGTPAAPNGTTRANGNGTSGGGVNGSTPPATGTGPPPAVRPAQPAATTKPSTNGGTTVAGTSTAAAEKMTEGINEIYARAASGGLTAKQEALAAMHEAESKFAGMKQMLARTMSEPGSNYGPEITEPIAKSAMQSQASAMMLSEANNALETLANMTLREVAQSPRQAPDKSELAESGRH